MRHQVILLILIGSGVFFRTGFASAADQPADLPQTRQHAEQSFQQLQQQEQQNSRPAAPPRTDASAYPADQFLVGTGQGDLSKGRLVCQRVSELAARAELAKQIRVWIKEHAVDRVRERTGAPVEQDIEVVREETVSELLQDVKIVDRRVDEAAGICSSTAVMPKSRIAPQPTTLPPASSPKP